MIGFIDDHRGAYGVEPICRVLPIAPSTYHADAARRADPARVSARARRDDALKPEVQRVFEENFHVYGVRKVWRQLKREGHDVARCTVARLMRALGLQGDPRQASQNHDQRQGDGVPVGPRQSAVQGRAPECAVALRLHLCGDLGGLRLRRLCHRCMRAAHRRLARVTNGARQCDGERVSTRAGSPVGLKSHSRLAMSSGMPLAGGPKGSVLQAFSDVGSWRARRDLNS
jgi:HTH-like domain